VNVILHKEDTVTNEDISVVLNLRNVDTATVVGTVINVETATDVDTVTNEVDQRT
jgi:hypothetical protein